MDIKIYCLCGCSVRMDGDVWCDDCYSTLERELEQAKDKITELEDELDIYRDREKEKGL